jgi:hypothetical protein
MHKKTSLTYTKRKRKQYTNTFEHFSYKLLIFHIYVNLLLTARLIMLNQCKLHARYLHKIETLTVKQAMMAPLFPLHRRTLCADIT